MSDERVDLADYLLDHYGICTQFPCVCLRGRWQGRACPHWHPIGATTWEELRVYHLKRREMDDKLYRYEASP